MQSSLQRYANSFHYYKASINNPTHVTFTTFLMSVFLSFTAYTEKKFK